MPPLLICNRSSDTAHKIVNLYEVNMKIDYEDEDYYKKAVEPCCGPEGADIAGIIASYLLPPKIEKIIMDTLKALKPPIDLWKRYAWNNGEAWDNGHFFKGKAHQVEYCEFLKDHIQRLGQKYSLPVKILLNLLQENEIIKEHDVSQDPEIINEIMELYTLEYITGEAIDESVTTIGAVEN